VRRSLPIEDDAATPIWLSHGSGVMGGRGCSRGPSRTTRRTVAGRCCSSGSETCLRALRSALLVRLHVLWAYTFIEAHHHVDAALEPVPARQFLSGHTYSMRWASGLHGCWMWSTKRSPNCSNAFLVFVLPWTEGGRSRGPRVAGLGACSPSTCPLPMCTDRDWDSACRPERASCCCRASPPPGVSRGGLLTTGLAALRLTPMWSVHGSRSRPTRARSPLAPTQVQASRASTSGRHQPTSSGLP
jgi:hypothetical protein